MKFLIVLVAVVAAVSAQAGRYRQGRQQSFASFRPQAAAPIVKRAPAPSSSDQNANVLRYDNDINPDGSYSYSYETHNGISAQEQGNANSAQGSFAYTAQDGSPISLSYIADENGFQPQGAHLPVGPPIPEAILRSLEWNAAHPEQRRK